MIYLRSLLLVFCLTITSLHGMESVAYGFDHMSLHDSQLQQKPITLRDAQGQIVAIDYQAALLSPMIKQRVDDGMTTIDCPDIEIEELKTIKNVLEEMAATPNIAQAAQDLQGGQEAVDRWGSRLKHYLYKEGEFLKDPKSEKIVSHNRFTKRFDALGKFSLPLLRQILKQEVRKEIRGNRLMTDQFLDVWAGYILPLLADDREWQKLQATLKVMTNRDTPFSFEELSLENPSPITSIACSADGNLLLTGHQDGSLTINKKGVSTVLPGHKSTHIDKITALAISESGNWFVAASRVVKVLNNKGEEQKALPITNLGAQIQGIILSPDNKWLVVNVGGYYFQVWDTTTWKRYKKRQLPEGYTLGSMAFSSDSNQFAIVSYDCSTIFWAFENSTVTINIFDTESWKRVKILHDEKMGNSSFAQGALMFSPSNKQLLAAGDRILVWDLPSSTIQTMVKESTRCSCLRMLSNNNLLASAAIEETEGFLLKLWDTATWKVKEGLVSAGPLCAIRNIFVADKKMIVLAAASLINKVYKIDLNDFFSVENYFNTKLSYSQYLFLKQIAAKEITSLQGHQEIIDTFDPNVKIALEILLASKQNNRCAVM